MARDQAGLLLRAMAARSSDGSPSRRIFVLGGPHERRVNVPAQQIRALNLAWALNERGQIADGSQIVVVGAGVAGVTFATAATAFGGRVVLVDEHEEPITVQRASDERYLDPNLFDWPNDGWDDNVARLPRMNWRGGRASQVRNELVASFAWALDDRLTMLPQSWVASLEENGHEVRVSGADLRDLRTGPGGRRVRGWTVAASRVVVATGFLPEDRVEGAVSGSYWRDARLEDLNADTRRALVVGDGDGALTELFRLALKDSTAGRFQHEQLRELAGAALPKDVFARLRRRVLDIENEARTRLDAGTAEDLADAKDLDLGLLDGLLRAQLRGRRIDLISGTALLRANSFLLNRFLAARLRVVAGGAIRLIGREYRVDPGELDELAEGPRVWRTGPPVRRRTSLCAPAFDMVATARLLAAQQAHHHIAGLVEDMLDSTRTAAWNANPFTLATETTDEPGFKVIAKLDACSADKLGTPGEVVVQLEPNSCRERITVTATALAMMARALEMAKSRVWWAGFGAPAVISLDVLAIACDLPASRVAATLNVFDGPIRLVSHRPVWGSRDRTWVEVGANAASTFDAELVANVFAVGKLPPTWSTARPWNVSRDAAPLMRVVGERSRIGESLQAAKRVADVVGSDLLEHGGEQVANAALEGLLRAEPVPAGLLHVTMARLAGQVPRPETAELLVDLLVRGLSRPDGRVVRRSLLLFGLGGPIEDPRIAQWVAQGGSPSPAPPTRRTVLSTALADITPAEPTRILRSTERTSLALSRGHLRSAMRLLGRPRADDAMTRALVAWLDGDREAGLKVLRQARQSRVMDLSFAGLQVGRGFKTLEAEIEAPGPP